MTKDVEQMTRKDFKELPLRKWDEDIGEFDQLIILPTRKKHDSGYAVMDFVAVRDQEPICRLSGCSDVLHIDGIWTDRPRSGWSIDCLLPSRLLRLFRHRSKLTAGLALSSFEIFATTEEKR
jgi:hypothetical protein